MSQPTLSFERIRVNPDRIEMLVRVHNRAFRFTNANIIAACLERFPNLAYHACHNECGKTFAAVMNNTSLPHLLEHLVIDLQTQAEFARQEKEGVAAVRDVTFTGTTQWSTQDDMLAEVSVSFRDDLVALAACKKALGFLNDVCGC